MFASDVHARHSNALPVSSSILAFVNVTTRTMLIASKIMVANRDSARTPGALLSCRHWTPAKGIWSAPMADHHLSTLAPKACNLTSKLVAAARTPTAFMNTSPNVRMMARSRLLLTSTTADTTSFARKASRDWMAVHRVYTSILSHASVINRIGLPALKHHQLAAAIAGPFGRVFNDQWRCCVCMIFFQSKYFTAI